MENTTFSVDFEMKSAKLALDSICIYRKLLDDDVISSLRLLLDYINMGKGELSCFTNLYSNFFFYLAKNGANSLEEYVVDKIIFDENSFSLKAQIKIAEKDENLMERAAANDLANLQLIARLNPCSIKNEIIRCFENSDFKYIVERLPEWKVEGDTSLDNSPEHVKKIKNVFYSSSKWKECIVELRKFHENYGCGIFAMYRAFVWERENNIGYCKGIEHPDPISLSDLIGYEKERSLVLENTEQFLKGFSANNALLHGDRGTGKSSTVKAVLNKYYTEGLRMIEVPKAYLTDFPYIIRDLKDRPQKFIIFVDDLVFADDEQSYTALKAMLEGGLENKSSNMIIYATSNRRHLVKEYFDERPGIQASSSEVHASDSVQEKLSLADRFGINIVFSSPTKNEYLNIVDGIAEKRKLKIDKELLHSEALKWEIWYNGRSARTARQFIDWIEGKLAMNEI
ncbi:putative ATPase (AAA+ superfamily) [Clostridium pasteurianum DSM 525 = ATCC 6013]|uniref:Putative ATPase (AAA+ superfamily) n=1 Tax=Clostridium pasteurianum DSM 525 = ATCC 6013 TaxID=1262449 RepID=A0A0H3J503_CLOPA|nr:ATP-binding protein [Clostridium pasteurianum]AJA49006.1 putative ATPase (AAA+ superfamily) [Clostridium pasteurianum DSM 525 = ATCC 6013]AJA52994.1 putative ATPase (AAA+ superfamily) [Clostridium pasteurianum DSM 525 = ATCC 6013]AOZ76212.1 AAA+ family ATPase [Clostridium pasteurianum DSM 525 = ATCC 6013]AOZ80008.1 AAA+ family ATPase [Clostridium pasteurianum]ELP60302.1 hypothetical protein F502_06682 [Clostridium pasteurianum DSM 525 = ATCC 6013]